MLVGVGILSNSLFYVAIMIPLFLFIYQAIVLAEENFLRNKFGAQFDSYCEKVNRWIPDLRGIGKTFQSMRFNWKRYVLKEYNTFYVWIGGIILLLLLKYPELTSGDTEKRNRLLVVLIPLVILAYLITRYLKKSGRLTED